MKAKHLVLAFALINAALYSCVLPLWEGFDEPFHFGYVETLSALHRLPVLHRTTVSVEIQKSMLLTPLSWLLSPAIPGSISFEQWFDLSKAEQVRREQELAGLPRELRRRPSDLMNYEAQQAPLAYAVLAPLDQTAWRQPLRREILWLRLFASGCATILLYISLAAFVKRLGLRDVFAFAVIACVFESQMLWASVAHVGNDWLAIPLTLLFLTSLARTAARNGAGTVLLLAIVFSAGLLAKAYFLAFVPIFIATIVYRRARGLISSKIVAIALLIPLGIAGPWYVRNVFLYGSISGTQQSAAGIGFAQVIAAIPHIPWGRSAMTFTLWSLWTGNWSFVSFSRTTLSFEALLLCASFAMYLIFLKRITKPELWVLAACGCFLLALAYQTCATWVHTNGASTHPEPWYAQGIIPCIWALCFTGLRASGVIGRIVAILLCLVSAWIAELTYVAKLLPMYGGAHMRSSARNVANWWIHNPTENLQGVMLGPVWLVYVLLAVFSLLLMWITASSVRALWRFA